MILKLSCFFNTFEKTGNSGNKTIPLNHQFYSSCNENQVSYYTPDVVVLNDAKSGSASQPASGKSPLFWAFFKTPQK